MLIFMQTAALLPDLYTESEWSLEYFKILYNIYDCKKKSQKKLEQFELAKKVLKFLRVSLNELVCLIMR